MSSERIIFPTSATLAQRNRNFNASTQRLRRNSQQYRYSSAIPKSRTSTWLIVSFLCCLCFIIISGCSSTARKAPVIDRTPAPAKIDTKTKATTPGERPGTYTVKRGDTLFAIALDFGLDYKELAAWNDITNPGEIRIGQQLRLTSPGEQVVTAPLKTIPSVSGRPVTDNEKKPSSDTRSANTPLLKVEPKAVVLPYSDENLVQLKRESAVPKLAEAKPELKPEPTNSRSEGEDNIDWGWPTKGTVVNGFSEANNIKGIDISGKDGQSVQASAPGKVIYSGSGIRGYGKLIILKHGKNFASVYAHNKQILVKEGQSVVKGQKIAEMGSSDADHVILHFEIRRLGIPVDPMKYLSQDTAS